MQKTIQKHPQTPQTAPLWLHYPRLEATLARSASQCPYGYRDVRRSAQNLGIRRLGSSASVNVTDRLDTCSTATRPLISRVTGLELHTINAFGT